MMNSIQFEIEKYFQKYPPAAQIFNDLYEIGDVYVLGGLLREYKDNQQITNLRDADFCISIQNEDLWKKLLLKYPHKINRFGGYKFRCEGFPVDVWDVRNTWAFKNNIIDISGQDYFEKLSQSVFLNLDAIIYDLKNDRWNETIYDQAMESGVLDIVLKENPFIELNILRSMMLRRKYHMRYSGELTCVIQNGLSTKPEFVRVLMEIQARRYGYSVLRESEIVEELEMCK